MSHVRAARREWARLQREFPRLKRYRLEFNPRLKRTLGRCFYDKPVVELSLAYARADGVEREHVIDTVRHEAAHVLAGYAHGDKHAPHHGEHWKREARRVGAKPERCSKKGIRKHTAKWHGACEADGCDNEWYRHRLRKAHKLGWSRCPCGGTIRWTDRHLKAAKR